MNGAYLSSGLRLLGAIVLDGTVLFPSQDGFAFDIVGFQVLDIVGLTDGLNQRVHLVWELGDEDHSLEMRRDGAFGCCHPGESYEDSIDGKSGIGVSRDDDVHCPFEFFVCGCDPGFAISLFKVFPGQRSEHSVNVGVLFNSLLEEVQNGCSDGWMKTEHDVSKSLVIDVEPGLDFRLVLGVMIFASFPFFSF